MLADLAITIAKFTAKFFTPIRGATKIADVRAGTIT
jgi:hypothetical protein